MMNEVMQEQKWYGLEELAELTGYEKQTLKTGSMNLKAIMADFGIDYTVESKIVNMGGHRNVKVYSEKVLETLRKYQLRNSTPNAVKEKDVYIDSHSGWYTLAQMAELCGYASANALLANPNTNVLLNQFNNSDDIHLGGYHNTQKFYSENVLKALKQYQLRNSAPNAVKNKEAAITGNISVIQHETVKQTIDKLLDNPDTLQMLLTESLARNKALGMENKRLNEIISEQKPKVEWFDNVANSENLTEIGTVGKMVGVGARKIFTLLKGDKIIQEKYSDGIRYYIPYSNYDRYFVSIPTPFTVGDRTFTRNKLMFNSKGVIWATVKYKEK